MNRTVSINSHVLGAGTPVYLVAEMSANHNHDFGMAVNILKSAKDAGADAVKVQTYTADSITLDCRDPVFQVAGTIWEGRNLHDLYKEAAMPWEWQPRLKAIAAELGLDFFSSPFDPTSVEFLEQMEVPAYKIASFELVDIPLIRKVARTGKPVIISTGMASRDEIQEAIDAVQSEGNNQIILLKCTSAYPAAPEEMNLRTIPDMRDTFGVPVGLSDHTMGIESSVAAVALGACMIEKHFTLSRSLTGPDSTFSLEPDEFRQLAASIRRTEASLGTISYEASPKEAASRMYRRSLFAVDDIHQGEAFTPANIRSIRPSNGLHPRHWDDLLGKKATCEIARGTPLEWRMIRAH
jgi:pseudaminic acid synthase